MDKSIALIGGGGFIGTNLTKFFADNGYNVLSIGRNLSNKFNFFSGNIQTKNIDVNNTFELIEALYLYENVVWLVNDLLPGSFVKSLKDDFDCNVSPLVNFLEKASDLNLLKKFVFISSGGVVYGNPDVNLPIKENSSRNPISTYGLSKLISEEYVSYITIKSPFNSIIFRPSNVYGKFQNFNKLQGIVGYAFNAMIKNSQLDLYGGGEVIRDFINVTDLALAIKISIENPDLEKVEVFNVGSQKGYSIFEIIKIIEEIGKTKILLNYKESREFDCNFNVLNIEKIQNKLDWNPSINIVDGLIDVWDSLKNNI
jgi:UDP-glucose 4-epimerase